MGRIVVVAAALAAAGCPASAQTLDLSDDEVRAIVSQAWAQVQDESAPQAPAEAPAAPQADADLAKQLANPVASLISVPFQFNYDCCFGPEDADRFTLNIQPVVPIALNEDWNLIVRTIVPVIYSEAPASILDDDFGLGDTTQSFFFAPSRPVNGIVWGLGPAFLWPTATEPSLGNERWGAGPTGLILKQSHGWTYGVLANHIWSFADAGGQERDDVNRSFLQPFLSYTFPNTVQLSLNSESTYDWEADEWTVPINAGVSRIFKFGGQRVSLGVQGRVYAVSPDGGPEWGARAIATFLFPR
jgi:hypothetical protein